MQMHQNVLFVNLPARSLEDINNAIKHKDLSVSLEHEITMPLGIMYLSSYIKSNYDVTTSILDYVLELERINTYDSIDQFILEPAKNAMYPDIISISLVFSTSYEFYTRFLDVARERWPAANIVVGGHHATSSASKLVADGRIDAVIRGEGEQPLLSLVDKFRTGVIEGEAISNLDKIPFPDWDLIDMEKYVCAKGSRWDVGGAAAARMAVLITTRGCPNRCTFCASHVVHGRNLRRRSIDNVVEEMKQLYTKYGVTLFIPWDDMFTAGKGRTLELLEKIRELGIPNLQIQFQNGLSINTLDEELIDQLVLTGMPMTALAIESGSEYTQKHLIKKNCNLEKAQHVVSYLQKKGVYVRCLYILGFPHETKELMYETINFAKKIKADWSVFSIASPLVGSEMYDELVSLGIIKDDPDLWGKSTYSNRKYDTPEISASEIEDLTYRANLDCNFFNNPNLERGEYHRALKLYSDVLSKFPHHIVARYCKMICYINMGRTAAALATQNIIRDMIRDNDVAKEMYYKYNERMPLIYIDLITFINSVAQPIHRQV